MIIALLKLDVITSIIAAGKIAHPANILKFLLTVFIFVPAAHIRAAVIIITAILTSSAGWKLIGPMYIHLLAPWLSLPKNTTATTVSSDTIKIHGANLFSQ